MNPPKKDILVHKVYQSLKNMILSGDLKPGEKVYQEKIAAKLGVSRTPLVKAFQILEHEMLLVSIPRRGMYIRQNDLYDILNAYECRQGIETTAIRIISSTIKSEEIEELRSLFDPFLNSKTIHNEDYLKADFEFHSRLVQLTKNDYLINMNKITNVVNQTYKLGLIREPNETLSEHLKILSAMETKDVGLAEEYMRNHMRKSIEKIKLKIAGN
jgi:DNA-binding GntR family transcriptional regulator